MAKRRTIGLIGLGAMGRPIVNRIMDAGWHVVVYDRKDEVAKPFAEHGATVAGSPREVAENADIVFTMVTDDTAVRDVVFGGTGVFAGMSEGKILVDMTTASPELALELESEGSEIGVKTLDVRVSGSVDAAESGDLLVLIGGESQVIDRVCPVLDLIGRKFVRTGGHSTAAVVKLALNVLLGIEMEALAEAYILARKSGIAPSVISEAISISGMASPFIKGKLKLINANDYGRRFSLRLMQKDLRLALAEGEHTCTPLPATSSTNEMAKAAMARGYSDLDMASLFMAFSKISGVRQEAVSARQKEPAQAV